MKRTKARKPINNKHLGPVSAILCADIHFVESNPVCRLDDLAEETQWIKIDWLKSLQEEHNCPILHSGDLIDYWKSSPELLTKITEHLPSRFYTVLGNHDLPQHNLELARKSGVTTLTKTKQLTILNNTHWGQEPEGFNYSNHNICVWHVMTYQGKSPYPGCSDPKAASLLRKYPQFDLIVTGDNHKPFVEEHEGRLLINPGSLFRLTAGQQNHKPRVYLWYAESNTVEAVYVPIKDNVISREHIDTIKERDDRINAFISTLDDTWEAEMSFEENLKIFQKKNKTDSKIMDIIYKSIEN